MATPPTLPTLAGLTWSRHRKPGFKTRIAKHVSGREVRSPLMQYPIYEFEATYSGMLASASPKANVANLGANSQQLFEDFFEQMQGQSGTFLYVDPNDNTVTGQLLGVGDGSTKVFTFARTQPGGGFNMPVGWVTTINNVYVSGVSTGAYTFAAPNTLTMTAAPAAAAQVTADFVYAFNCRFSDDTMDFEEFMSQLFRLQKVTFQSVKSWLGG